MFYRLRLNRVITSPFLLTILFSKGQAKSGSDPPLWRARDDSSQASTEKAWILPIPIEGLQLCKTTHMITNTKRLSFSLSLSEKLVVSRFSGLKSLKHGHQMSCDYCPFALQFNAQPFLLSSKFAHFLHLLIVNLAQGAELAGQNWRKDLLSFFHGSQCVTTMFPFEFPMCSPTCSP